jgi:hypothetical protein
MRDRTLTLTPKDKEAARQSYIGKEYGLKTPDGKL